MSGVNIGLHFDLRNPQLRDRGHEQLTTAVIELAEQAEALGFGSIWTAEHHFTADGDCASPLLLCAALAARTTRIRIGTNLVVLPLHHPVRLAEDAAFLAILSAGRFDLGVGAGYIEDNFAAFGQQVSHRPSLMEEGVEVIRKAWSGEPIDLAGKRWTIPPVALAPLPAPHHRPRLFMGGFAPPAIRRAARLADGFLCGLPASIPIYLDALQQEGRDPATGRIVTTRWWVIDADPEATWARIGGHALYQVNNYIEAGSFGDVPLFADADELLKRGHYSLYDGPAAVKELKQLFLDVPQIVDVHFYGLLPGESVESGALRMAYVAEAVLANL